MIIDLTEHFKKLREFHDLKVKNEIHDLFLTDYIKIKEEICNSDFNKSLSFKYGSNFDASKDDDWCQVIALANNIYDESLEVSRHHNLREYIRNIGLSLKTTPKKVSEHIVVCFPKAKKDYFYILTEIEKYMIMISEFREDYSKKIDDSEYMFQSYLDLLLTADYLKFGMLEDFILEQGAFANDTVDIF